MAYFKNFPKISYNGITARNLLLKSAIVAEVFAKKNAFYPYIVQDAYRPDMVAGEVYGSPFYDWVVYFSNSIVDPYYDWPLSSNDLDLFMQKKYGKTKYELMNTISYYEYTGITSDSIEDVARKSWKMSPDTHAMIDNTAGWSAVTIYDEEVRVNDSKRSIQLLSPIYLGQIETELGSIFNK